MLVGKSHPWEHGCAAKVENRAAPTQQQRNKRSSSRKKSKITSRRHLIVSEERHRQQKQASCIEVPAEAGKNNFASATLHQCQQQ
mmetsp:Transcript_41658/g.79775  ORF Transcript_41658/g.79775 Transcript_41658/m.79775 type:complete len:85 (+) Transcript_41658:153-407(+)